MSKALNIVITGANSGVGFQTMKDLYLQGHNVIFGSRNQTRNVDAIKLVLSQEKQSLSNKDHFLKAFSLDLSKKQSIEKFVQQVKAVYNHIDILINNAGFIANDFALNSQGLQMTVATNHFGHFYLTYLLIDLMKQTAKARIINVSSMMHYQAKKNPISDLECKNSSFSSNGQYAISKFLNVVFTVELARRLSKYPNIKTFSLHPGIVDSNFGADVCLIQFFNKICCCLYVNNTEGARTSIYLATHNFNELKNGQYYHSNTQHREMDERARDPQLGQNLWKMSQDAYGIKFEV